MSSFESDIFYYFGKWSSDLPIKVSIVDIGNNSVETPVSGSKSLIYEEMPNKDTIAVQGTKMDRIKFKVIISPLENKWTNQLRYDIFEWLGSRTPQAFKTNDNTSKVIYGIFTNINPVLVNQSYGYCELDFEATTQYWLTDLSLIPIDCTSASPSTPYSFIINNLSNVQHPKYNWGCYYLPKMYVDLKNGATNFKLINQSDGNNEINLSNLTANDKLFIDNNLPSIESVNDTYVLNNFNGNFLKLTKGNNILTCYYPCTIQFECQFPQFV